ncbi:serine--tRNA ligase [Planctomicrobium sp. SH668]|uniref:serine--tRNA ligase n=1 Tax=Planctomicrobium sp. SH668 TaxID=3448126 RepID=UPI003F5C1046
MLDLQFICDNAELIEKNCRDRGVKVDMTGLINLRSNRTSLITEGDALRHEQKEVAGKIPKASSEERPALIELGKQLKEKVAINEAALRTIEVELRAAQTSIPNLTHPEAPIGGEAESITVKEWGQKPQFQFKPLDHVEIASKLDLIDFEAGTTVAGSGFYFLKNEAVLLEMALIQYAIEKVRAEGFTLYTTPDLARDEVLEGIGFSPRGNETQIYSVDGTDLSLVATAEITLGGSQRDKIFQESELPIKMAGISHCFRTEAGGHGKAVRGIYRVHQFTKVEMFAFTAGDLKASDEVHAQIVRIEEEIFQGLGIPYRLLNIASGDLGGPAYRKFDIEAWMPGRGDSGEYGEVTSASNCTDYQARRLGVRSKSPERKGTQFVHTLNGTAVACTRAIIAILENYQQEDGSVIVPEVLRKWVGTDRIVAKKR